MLTLHAQFRVLITLYILLYIVGELHLYETESASHYKKMSGRNSLSQPPLQLGYRYVTQLLMVRYTTPDFELETSNIKN